MITKNYLRRPDIFADVFNQFLYHGRQEITPDRLIELDITEIAVPYGADNAFVPEQRYRDVAKQVTEAAAAHKKSSKSVKPTSDEYLSGFWKSDRLLPVVTLVIYFGAGEWDGPMSLKEMYTDCDTEILKYAADYRINLVAPSRLSDDEIDEFATSFREIMKYIKYSTDGEKLKETVDMCLAIQEIREEGREEGEL